MTALKILLVALLLLNVTAYTQLYGQRNEYLATFPGGVVYLPTVNSNSVVVKYHNIFGGVSKEAVFYPRGDTLTVLQLDTCKRDYIALYWAYDALEERYIDSTFAAKVKSEQMVKDNAKELRKTKRKFGFRGFLWGVPVGITLGVLAFVR